VRVDRLIVVPDGILFRLPFEALALPGSSGSAPIYVHDRFAVSYAPSASSLDSFGAAQERHYSKDALAFGVSKYPKPARLGGGSADLSPAAVLDDLYERQGFAIESLPHVKAELADLEERFAPDRIDVYQDQAATETALKALDLGAYRLIHLACHAFSDDSYPLRSALLMSPEASDREDGHLQVSEMYDLRTNADLVVLSACQTGRGAIVMNEGNLGLPRVFFYMGASSVLSTLWPVNDTSCAMFMKFFYDFYLNGEGKAEALRAAKKAMRSTRFAHPYFWASYTLTGRF
jgi:CHAT domain-containing protein